MKKKQQSILVISSQNKLEWIRIEDVLYLECANNYTDICLDGGRKVTTCHSLTWCCNKLDKSIIYKVCAHYGVNIFKIKEYIKAKRTVKFSDDISIVIPEDKVAAFNSFLEDHFTVL